MTWVKFWNKSGAAIAAITMLTVVSGDFHSHPILAHSENQPGSSTKPNHAAHHGKLEIPNGQPVPTVQLVVHPDAKRGWNLEVRVTHFRFAPERVNTTSSPTEGHAHLYIDGKKVTRLYGAWYYLEALPPGNHQLKVALNANGHEALFFQGKPIEATATIQVR